jgi:hypothetical protein
MLRIVAAIAFSVVSHFHNGWTGLAVVPFPGSLNAGAGASQAVTMHDAVLTGVALCVEIALFVMVPLCLRAYRRRQIRATYRISYDSRRQPEKMVIAERGAAPEIRKPATTAKRPFGVISGSRALG